MNEFEYQSRDASGATQRGRIEAADESTARRLLEQRGVEVLRLGPASTADETEPEREVESVAKGRPRTGAGPPQERGPRLSEAQALEATRRVADLSRAGVPLTAGLRSVADELRSGRLARVFRTMAEDSDRGLPLENILERHERRFPAHVVGLIRAARRTGHLEQALTQLVEQHFRTRDLARAVSVSLAYPLLVLTAALTLVLLLELIVVGQFEELFGDVAELPYLTQLLIWWSDRGLAVVGVVAAALLIGLATLRLVIGAAAWRGLVVTVPLLGPLWHWAGVARWTRLLALLIEFRVPLPDALRLAADGSGDAQIGQLARRMATGADQGRQLSEMLAASWRLPATLVPIVRWGEQSSELAGALRTASEMMEGRARLRSQLLRLILPPFALLIIAVGVGLIIMGLLLPLLELVDDLRVFM